MSGMLRRAFLLSVFAAFAAPAIGACTKTDPLYCDEDRPCTDPELPFCDLNGDYPASDGIGRTCIADPDPEADAGLEADAGGGPDASFCTAGEFFQCTDGTTAIYCNEQGTEYVDVDCGSDCNPDQGGCYCEPDTSTCADDQTIHCGADSRVEEIEACALGCNSLGQRCVDVNPSNGLAGFLDMTDAAPVVVLSNGAVIDTDDATIMDGDGSAIDVPAFQVTAQPGGVTIRVFAVKSLTIGDATVTGSRALAVVSDGDILVGGNVRLQAGATAEGTCVGGVGTSEGCGSFCAAVGGGGGGSFGGGGGDGGDATAGSFSGSGAGGGTTTGSATLDPLRGGCAGGGAVTQELGGDGGGALQLVSRTLIRIEDGSGQGHLNAGGERGQSNYGGGSGGGILLEAPRVVVSSGTTVVANGGGAGSYCGTSSSEDGTLSSLPALGGGQNCTDPAFGTGGNGGARSESATDGEDGSNASPTLVAGGGGGGGVGRIRVNVPVSADYVGGGAASPQASVGTLATR